MFASKYKEIPGIDIYWDNSYRFTLKWDASDAMKNRTERLYKALTKVFDDDYSRNAARLAAEHYYSYIGNKVSQRDLRDELESILAKYRHACWEISLEELRDQTRIEKNSEGLYKYELPRGLIQEYVNLYQRSLGNFYDEAYKYLGSRY